LSASVTVTVCAPAVAKTISTTPAPLAATLGSASPPRSPLPPGRPTRAAPSLVRTTSVPL
jgi:hypothetical protein